MTKQSMREKLLLVLAELNELDLPEDSMLKNYVVFTVNEGLKTLAKK